LHTDKTFIDDMADMVVEALSEPAQSVTEACVANNVGDVELQALDERMSINTAGVQGVGAGGELFSDDRRQVLKEKERLNARVAMFGVLVTVFVELLNGKSLAHMFGL
jgi:ferrochelatase